MMQTAYNKCGPIAQDIVTFIIKKALEWNIKYIAAGVIYMQFNPFNIPNDLLKVPIIPDTLE